jgi:hypothetical protein
LLYDFWKSECFLFKTVQFIKLKTLYIKDFYLAAKITNAAAIIDCGQSISSDIESTNMAHSHQLEPCNDIKNLEKLREINIVKLKDNNFYD